MFTDVHLKNFAAFSDFRWSGHGQVNVVVGENDTGKSHLLKVLYAVAKGVDDLSVKQVRPASAADVISNKLRWTFQSSPNLRTLVRHGKKGFNVEAHLHGKRLVVGFSEDGESAIAGLPKRATGTSTLFLPPKEVLTIFAAIEISRGKYEIYGFDDTYYDLLHALRVPPTQGEVVPELLTIAEELDGFIGGRIVRVGHQDEFSFRRGKQTYTMPQTADGIKKIGILGNLIRNRCLAKGTILFLDEPETNLHPRAISILTEVLFRLGQAGVQVYLATHSYFVLKKLEILAKRHQISVPFCSLVRQGDEIEALFSDMRDGMPDSPIIEESLRLYEEGYNVDLRHAGE